MTVSVAWYDPFYYAILFVVAIGSVALPLFPRRQGIGKRDYDRHKYYDEGEQNKEEWVKTYEEAVKHFKEVAAKTNTHYNPYFYCSPPNGRDWWCQRMHACNPVDHLAWFRWVYTLALGVNFSIQIKYCYYLFGAGSVGSAIDNQIWSSLIIGMGVAAVFVRFHVLQDLGFILGAWLTIMIWILKTWAPNLQLGYSITIVSITAVVAIAALGFCIFWAFCATASCLLCCCRDTVGHWLAIFFARLNMEIVRATTVTWCIYVPNYSISHFDDNDQTWLYRCMWTAAIIFVFMEIWRFACCRRDSACYNSWADPEKHTVFHHVTDLSASTSSYDDHAEGRIRPSIAFTGDNTNDLSLDMDPEEEEDDDNEAIPHAFPSTSCMEEEETTDDS